MGFRYTRGIAQEIFSVTSSIASEIKIEPPIKEEIEQQKVLEPLVDSTLEENIYNADPKFVKQVEDYVNSNFTKIQIKKRGRPSKK